MKFHWLYGIIFSLTVCIGHAEEGKDFYEIENHEIEVNRDQVLELYLDADVGEVRIVPGMADHRCLIHFKYPKESFKSRVQYKESRDELKIIFDKKGALHWDDENNQDMILELTLPTDVDINFQGKLKAGEVEMNLGGIRLKEFRVSLWAGEMEIRFDDPNPIIMEYLQIDAKIGQLSTFKLGNARFERANINGGIGEINVDLTGELIPDARARVDLDIGEADITLPHDVGIRMQISGLFKWMSSKNIDSEFDKHGRYYYSDDYDEMNPSFSIRITPGLGELSVYRD